MSEKQTKWGLFPGGDPRKFTPENSTATEEQINSWRFDCELWSQAAARGEIPSGLTSQAVGHEIEMTDCANSVYGGGFFEVEVPNTATENAAAMTDATFNEIMAAPNQPLPFKAVLG
jgi:hypothetical protein